MAKTYTDAEKAAALALYQTHGSTHVQREMGIPKGTLGRWVKATGAQTVRTSVTRKATEAAQADNKLRRQSIIHRIYGQTEKILDELEGPEFRTMVKATGGAEQEARLDFVPPGDRRTLIQALGSAMTTATNTEKIDADNGSGQVASMLESLIEGIGVPDE